MRTKEPNMNRLNAPPRLPPPRLRLRQQEQRYPALPHTHSRSRASQPNRAPGNSPLICHLVSPSAGVPPAGSARCRRPCPPPWPPCGDKESGATCAEATPLPCARHSGSPFSSPAPSNGRARAALGTGRHGGRHHCRRGGGPRLSLLSDKGGSRRKPGLRLPPARLPRRPTAPSARTHLPPGAQGERAQMLPAAAYKGLGRTTLRWGGAGCATAPSKAGGEPRRPFPAVRPGREWRAAGPWGFCQPRQARRTRILGTPLLA